jgi:crotonobetainyl-CoA:carnitine CoA-transferase CaiB-like acyl-CoA transferase
MKGMLSGLKVIDLSSVLAGPLTGTFLAECGALVIKVEAPAGDVTRTWRSSGEALGKASAYYAAANTGKKVETVDLKTAEGRSWLAHELSDADVLIQNMKASDLERMGLMPDSLIRQFPKLVHVRLVGTEFDTDRLAYDVVIQAETGFMSMNGHADRPPARLPVALMDVLASHQMRAAVLGGLYNRERNGEGCYAEVSLLGAGLTALANQGTNVLINQSVPMRQGSAHPNIAPYGDMLTCSDGEVVLAVGSDAQFQALCEVLNCMECVTDPKFSTNPSRVQHREALNEVLNAMACSWQRDDLRAALHRARVPAGAVFNVAEALDQPGVRESYVVTEEGLPRLKTSAIEVMRRSNG